MSRVNRRQVQAQETRLAILDAALSLFISAGYGATSIADIAERAGVAVPTVYASAGAKPVLLKLLLDRIDEQADIPRQAGELMASNDPVETLRRSIGITRTLAERCGDVLSALASAAGVDPELADTFRSGMQRHRQGAITTIQRLSQLGGLREHLDPGLAAALLATLTEPSVYRSLTATHGLSFDTAEQLLFDLLSPQLLAPARRRSRR